MQKSELTKEIINSNLKKSKMKYLTYILLALPLVYYAIKELIKNINEGATPLIVFSAIGVLFVLCFIINFTKDIIIRNKYLIGEGTVKTAFYNQNKIESKVTINGLKGIIFSTDSFTVGQNVYVIYNGKNALMCYSKDKYYV